MARKTGFIHSLRRISRVVVILLAVLLLFAIWQSYSKDKVPELPPAKDIAVLPSTPGADTGSDASVPAENAAEGGSVGDTGSGLTETRPVDGSTPDVAGAVTERPAETPEGVAAEESQTPAPNPAETGGAAIAEGTGLVQPRSVDGLIELPAIPGDNATYAIVKVEKTADNMMEITSSKTDASGTNYTTHRVTCAPLAAGVVAKGPSQDALSNRNETPEMASIPLGTAEALIVATACGNGN